MKYRELAIRSAEDLVFGSAPHPLRTKSGMIIGGGEVYPEINFTLPAIQIEQSTMDEVVRNYEQIIHGVLRRAAELNAPGVIVEFETLPPMTEFPDWGMRVVDVLLAGMSAEADRSGLKSVLRMTPNDNREFERPPLMRSGRYFDAMMELFERSAAAGTELLSIESVGGKELHDDALVNGDLAGSIFALCVLGVRDMRFLWTRLHGIATRHGVHCAGDTACGFGNTAMVLAEQRMIPRVFAAVVRAVTAVRSLVAYECGAVGPGKDCGYENPIVKEITGYPMAMEGKASACAHLSPMGNLAACACDTWSNESVQNIKLLGGMAPVCCMEQLVYDCRLMNEARKEGNTAVQTLKRWFDQSDACYDPQAFVLKPHGCIEIAKSIVGATNHYQAGVAAARRAIELIREGHESGGLHIAANEVSWIQTLTDTLDELPKDEAEFIDMQMELVDRDKFRPEEYELG